MYKVIFEPVGSRGAFSGENTLLDCARSLGVDIVSFCGGVGSCERCKVQVIDGRVTELTLREKEALTPDELSQGYRLACKAYPQSDVKIYIPPESVTDPQRTQVEGVAVAIDPAPAVTTVDTQLSAPTLESPQADVQRLWQTISGSSKKAGLIDHYLMKMLPGLLRENNWHVKTAVRSGEIIAIGVPGTRFLGMAVDIGSTKVAGYLVDLESGETLAAMGMMNPQISYGEDLVSRIVTAGRSEEEGRKLQNLTVNALGRLASDLCETTGSRPDQIVDVVIVGNTVIHHLVLGLPVKQLGLSPYTPVTDNVVDIKAREIGLDLCPGAYVHFLPIIAGYVGADHVAMLLAVKMDETDKTTLAIDIGTNTEICLSHNGSMTCVSCASGPAFEGAHISHGMRAAPGAIDSVRIDNGQTKIRTIGGKAPSGICGSGLVDAVAQMRLNKIIKRHGGMAEHPMVRKTNGQKELVLAERLELSPITISQRDIRELQLAKAAIAMGIMALVENAEIEAAEIETVFIAGAFGSFIDVKSAVTIGMLPDLPMERFQVVGNAAGTGARMALMSVHERKKAEQLAKQIGYIELAGMPDFNRKFAEATYL